MLWPAGRGQAFLLMLQLLKKKANSQIANTLCFDAPQMYLADLNLGVICVLKKLKLICDFSD